MQIVIDYVRGLEVGEIQSYRNLAIAPLIGDSNSLDYFVLSEALKQGFEITESGSVEKLYVSNNTKKNVLAIEGSLVYGGKQDRVFIRNAYFAKSHKGEIPVRCVEAGRWSWSSGVLRTPSSRKGSSFEFGGVVPKSLTKVAGQRDTWSGVETLLNEANISSKTHSIGEISKTRKKDFEKFKENFSLVDGQVGTVAVFYKCNKKSFVADVFDKDSIFKNYFDNLLESYILESGLDEKNKVDLTPQEARGFLDSVDSCEFNKRAPISLGEDFTMKGEGLLGASLCYNGSLVYANLITFPGQRDIYIKESSTAVSVGAPSTTLSSRKTSVRKLQVSETASVKELQEIRK